MTDKEKDVLFKEKYKKWHKHLVDYQDSYEAHLHLSYEKRLELEKKVAELVDFCNENGIYMHEPNDIAQFMISLKGNGSRELDYRGLSICTTESCYASIHCDETPEELEAHARRLAQADVDDAVASEKEAEEQKKREAEEMEAGRKSYEEACKAHDAFVRQQALEDLEALRKEGCPHVGPKLVWEDQDAKSAEEDRMKKIVDDVDAMLHGGKTEAEKFANDLVEKITAYDSRNEDIEDMPFDYGNVTDEQIAAVDNYVLQCVRFADAMDMGLSGVGLYTFNTDRTNAHYMMLSAFGLENDEAALCATKDYDYAADYDIKKGHYIPKGKLESRELLCWVLWKCAARINNKMTI
jgi:hypothetical protein